MLTSFLQWLFHMYSFTLILLLEIECYLPFLEANVDVYPKQEKYKVGDVSKYLKLSLQNFWS